MRPLVLGPEQRERIAAVKAHAEANVFPFARVYRMAHGMEPAYGWPDFLVELPVGFRVTFGIEEQESGTYRHLNVSVDGEDRWPNPVAVEAILDAFGMPPLLQSAVIKRDPLAGRERRNIVHVLAPYEPTKSGV